MAETTFVGRHAELKLLDRLWASQKATLLILYGRRRVGKTRLLTHWLHSHSDSALYWMAEPTSALEQLRSFSQILVNFADPETPASPDFTYDSWEHALRQVALLAKERRIAVFIDEVNYIIDVNPDIVGTLQKAWDQWLSKANLMFALCGSQMSIMQKHLMEYDAPLYGRAAAQIKLPPLPFSGTKEFFPEYSPLDRVKVYSIWGGIPAYWERLTPQISVEENLQEQLLPSNTWMLDEPRLLLQDFVSDPYNYVGIMRAIADGKHSLNEISERIGLTGASTSMYLSILRDTGFVIRRVPVTQQGTDSRLGRYYVTDPYLRFYYRFLAAYQTKIALGKQRQMLTEIQSDLPYFIETNTWQELCHEWVLGAGDRGYLPFAVDLVGSEWKRSYSVDVAGIDSEKRHLVLGSCSWTEPAGVKKAVTSLLKRTSSVFDEDNKGEWQVYYLLFSPTPWKQADQQEAQEVLRETKSKSWHTAGVKLLSLDELDHDLNQWATLS